jgi:hypothetical protein
LERLKQVEEVKNVPKEKVKSHLIYESCITDGKKAECEKMRDAIAATDAGKCKDLSSPVFRAYCAALASSDPAKCKPLPAGEERGRCEAWATDDASRCPKDSVDCQNMARNFAGFKKGGLGAVEGDPVAAAAAKGRDACKPFIAAVERVCVENGGTERAEGPAAKDAKTTQGAKGTPAGSTSRH